jgi:hypothetical protein
MLLSDAEAVDARSLGGRLIRPVLRRVGVISSLMKSQPLQHVNDNRSISGYKSVGCLDRILGSDRRRPACKRGLEANYRKFVLRYADMVELQADGLERLALESMKESAANGQSAGQ